MVLWGMLLILFVPVQMVSAQVVFQNTLGDDACYEEANSILPVGNGDYLVSAAYYCGTSWQGKLLRLNSQGDTIWTRPELPANGFMRKSNDGNYIYIGGNHAGLAYDTVVVTKANEQGDTIWTRHLYFAQCNNLAYDLISTSDNGYVLCGIYAPDCSGQSFDNSFVVKLNEAGEVQWTTLLKGPGNDEVFEVRQLANGGYAVYGWTDSQGAGLADNYLVLLNEQGDSVFSRTYGNADANYGYGMDLLPHNQGFITIGYSDSIYATRLDMAGNVVWKRALGIPTGSIYCKALYTKDKHFAFIACENDSNSSCSATLYKTDTLGNLVWRKNFGGLFREFTEDKPGSFLLAGFHYFPFPAKPKAYYARFDTTFNPLDTVNVGLDEIVDDEVQVIVIKNLVDRNETIRFQTNSISTVNIALYDVVGRKISSSTGKQNIALPNPAQAGIYIWQATFDGQMQSGKLVVQ